MNDISETILIGTLQKFSLEDGPGIRTTVFLKGCPLNCLWCHNPELINSKQELIKSSNNCIGCGHCIKICPQGALAMDKKNEIQIDRTKCNVCLKCVDECYAKALRPVGKSMTIAEILHIAEQDKGFYDNTGGGITLSGGEILMHSGIVIGFIDEAGKKGIKVCIDTSGFGDSKALLKMALNENVTDILYDIKSIDDEIHKKYTGVSNKLIIENLRMLTENKRTKNKLIMRMPLIGGVNDSEEIIKKTGDFYKEIGIKRVNLIPYHSLGISKKKNVGNAEEILEYQEKFEQPTEKRLTEIENYFRNVVKLDVKILGRT